MMSKQSMDEVLIIRAKKGDKKAFNALVLRYQNRVSQLIGRYLFQPNEVLDVTQEVFIKAYRSLHTFRGDSAFYTWLYRIAINTAKNHTLDLSRRPPSQDVDVGQAEGGLSPDKLHENASPEHLLLRDEIEQVIQDTIEQLPDDLRVCLMLRETDGLTYEEVAQVMECPVGTVRSRLFRAREIIVQRLKHVL